MTILFFSRLFYPHIGGVEKHAMEVGKRLVKRGFKVVLLTERLDNKRFCSNVLKHQNKREETIEGIKVIRIPVGKDGWSKKFRIWAWLWRHQDLIQQANIVHCHDVFFWYLPFRFLYLGKPVYTTFHGYEGNKIPGRRAVFMHKLAEKLSWGNICVGNYFNKWYGTKPTFVTHGGVDKVPSSKFQVPSPKLKLKVLFIGRLKEETGIMVYLEAIRIIKKQKINFDLTILGDGSLREVAEQFSYSNKLNTRFLGFVNNVEDFLPDARFVFVSRYLGILEAMAAKKLVFAHYNNVIKEDYLRMTPFAKWIVIEKEPEKLAEKIKYYLAHPEEEKKMIEQAYNWVKDQAWDKVADIYLKLWQKR